MPDAPEPRAAAHSRTRSPADSHTRTPAQEYSRRLAHWRERSAAGAKLERSISNWRLVVFLIGLALAWLSFGMELLPAYGVIGAAVAFLALVVAHARVTPARVRADRAVAFYERATARLEDRWAGSGETGTDFFAQAHPCAEDLDLFGTGSLFELLCTARTRAGQQKLAAWLQAGATPEQIRARQTAVDELRGRVDLREEIALLGADVGAAVHPKALAAWGNAPPVLLSSGKRFVAAAIMTGAIGAAVAWQLAMCGPLPLLAIFAAEALFALPLRRRVQKIARAVELPGQDLALLAAMLARFEAERFTAPLLVRLRTALDTNGVPPSRRIKQLHRLINLLDARRNQLFAAIAPLLLWATQLTLAVESWRSVSGPAIGRWLEALGDFEALCCLSGYAYEHAGDPFPEIVEDGPLFDGEGLGHPLLPLQRCVRNDVSLGAQIQALVVSGSNMSGKSTLLRTVGTNAVLGMAGAPVRARRLKLSPLVVGTSMRIQDSLQEGTSRFYAEIQRLRRLVDLARGPVPLLFLLDEILHGTNSHDRRIGAEAIVRGLLAREAIGLVTTHDLTLTQIADNLAPRAMNVHFEDHLEDGKMSFDYRMRPGVVEKSNALALMRSVGLEV
jgi:hypothetical protein